MITMDNISKSVIMLTPFCKKESGKANAIFDLPAGSRMLPDHCSIAHHSRQFAKVFIVSIHEVCYAFEDEHSKEEATDGESQCDLRRKLL